MNIKIRKLSITVTIAILILVGQFIFIQDKQVNQKAVFKSDFDLSIAASELWREKGLYDNTVIQSIAFDNENQKNYSLQLISGDKTLPGEKDVVSAAKRADNGDLCVTQMDLQGNIVGHMYLKSFGHGVQFGVEADGKDSYLWTEVDAVSDGSNGWGRRLCRFKFANEAVLTPDSDSLTKYELIANVDRTTCNIDVLNGYLTMRYRKNGNFRYGVFKLADIKAGKYKAIYDVEQPANLGTFQGYASLGEYLYLLDGNSYNGTISVPPKGNTYITAVDLKSGKQMSRQLTTAGSELSFREPEGMAIQITNMKKPSEARLCFSFASGNSGSRKASIYYYKNADLNGGTK